MSSAIKAGYITCEFVSGFTYNVNLFLYTDAFMIDQDPTLDIPYAKLSLNGIPLPDTLLRKSKVRIDTATYLNTYSLSYTFPTAKAYVFSYSSLSRLPGVKNMKDSQVVPFYIETYLLVSSISARDNSNPGVAVFPTDSAVVSKPFVYYPGAYDSEGDSISYECIVPEEQKSLSVASYSFPVTTKLDSTSGRLSFTPGDTGVFDFCIRIDEWREGIRIGYVLEDFVVSVTGSSDTPPVIGGMRDTCILLGDTLNYSVSVIDSDKDSLILKAYGALFGAGQTAAFSPSDSIVASPVNATIAWVPDCKDIMGHPYEILVKATDHSSQGGYSDINHFFVKLKAPRVEWDSIKSMEKAILLTWKPYPCQNIASYTLFRKTCGGFKDTLTLCEDFSARDAGFEFLATVPAQVLQFLDSGIVGPGQGNYYCYLIQADFPEPGGGVSSISSPVCGEPSARAPELTEVSVLKTDSVKGVIHITWHTPIVPQQGDTTRLKRGEGTMPSVWVHVADFTLPSDTEFFDTLNTLGKTYTYIAETQDTAGTIFDSDPAATPELFLQPSKGNVTLRWTWLTPWDNLNSEHEVFRRYKDQSFYSKVGQVQALSDTVVFTDTGLSKRDSVCYRIRTLGTICRSDTTCSTLNFSPEVCTIAADSALPCPPELTLTTGNECMPVALSSNRLSWKIDTDTTHCNPDIAGYKIYFSLRDNTPILFLSQVYDTLYQHDDTVSLAGCYAVTAYNYYGMESSFSNRVCTDICTRYILPDLITPNNDNLNDVFKPLPDPVNVEAVELWVYNRWGALVYHYPEGNPIILWNGESSTGQILDDGVYFYQARVKYRRRLEKINDIQDIKGYIQIVH